MKRNCGLVLLAFHTANIIPSISFLHVMPKVVGEYFLACAACLMVLSCITKWIDNYSRNPDVLGLFLVCTGMTLIYCNIPMIVVNVAGIIFMHIMTVKHESANDKKRNVHRYIGNGRFTYRKLKCLIYLIGLIWCVLYTLTLVLYSGIHLSWLWMWPLGAAFCLIRFVMIIRDIRVPKVIAMPYHVLFPVCFIVFVFFELQIIEGKFHIPDKNLDYVIVLGAGVNGYNPSNTLKMRIDRAYDYMVSSPKTILIASGGQGANEIISEAECIKRELVKRGIPEDRILLEDKSTSTEENLRFSYEIINSDNASVGIITNSFHEYRASLIAYDTGYTNVQSVPARTLYPVGIHYTVREFFGVIKIYASVVL